MPDWKHRNGYQPGAPLYARDRLKFSGRVVEHGALIPPEYIKGAEQHLRLWQAGKAGHTMRPLWPQPPTLPSSLDEMLAREADALEAATAPLTPPVDAPASPTATAQETEQASATLSDPPVAVAEAVETLEDSPPVEREVISKSPLPAPPWSPRKRR